MKLEVKLLFICLLVIFITHCGSSESNDSDLPPNNSSEQANATISEEGGVVKVTDNSSELFGTQIVIPVDALTESKTISIHKSNIETPIPTFLSNQLLSVNLEPDGQVFSKPVLVRLPYKDDNNDGIIDDLNIDESRIKVIHYDETSNEWVYIDIENVDFDDNFVEFYTNHFSSYALSFYKTNIAEFDKFYWCVVPKETPPDEWYNDLVSDIAESAVASITIQKMLEYVMSCGAATFFTGILGEMDLVGGYGETSITLISNNKVIEDSIFPICAKDISIVAALSVGSDTNFLPNNIKFRKYNNDMHQYFDFSEYFIFTHEDFVTPGVRPGGEYLIFLKESFNLNENGKYIVSYGERLSPGSTNRYNKLNFSQSCTAPSLTLLYSEDFESGLLPDWITTETKGGFSSSPSIKLTNKLSGNSAFGFGRSVCNSNCFNNYSTSLIINFEEEKNINKIIFSSRELIEDWGSCGGVFADGERIDNYFSCGNTRHEESQMFEREFVIDKNVSNIVIKVHDITDESEIYIDNLKIWEQ